MARSGSLPWLLLAAVLTTVFGIYLEITVVKPLTDGLVATDVWAQSSTEYTARGKSMVYDWISHLVLIMAAGIWFGVFVDARRSI